SLLGLGPEGDLVVHRVGDLRGLLARARDAECEEDGGDVDRGRGLGGDDRQPVRGQSSGFGPAFVRRRQVTVAPGRLQDPRLWKLTEGFRRQIPQSAIMRYPQTPSLSTVT